LSESATRAREKAASRHGDGGYYSTVVARSQRRNIATFARKVLQSRSGLALHTRPGEVGRPSSSAVAIGWNCATLRFSAFRGSILLRQGGRKGEDSGEGRIGERKEGRGVEDLILRDGRGGEG